MFRCWLTATCTSHVSGSVRKTRAPRLASTPAFLITPTFFVVLTPEP